MKTVPILFSAMVFAGAAAAQSQICFPPKDPFVPTNDDDFRAFQEMIAADFQRYFSEVTPYIACLDRSRQQAMDRVREMSERHSAFWQRAEGLGVVSPDR